MVVNKALDVAIVGLTKSVNAATESLKEGFALAGKAQKATLSLGMSLEQARGRLGPSLELLRGSIDGKLTDAFKVYGAGLEGNTKGIAQLINQQRLTGDSSLRTSKVFASLVSIGGVQVEAANNLGTNLIKTGAEYRVSTSNLVAAISSMEKHFATMNMLGMSESMTTAVAELTAMMGPQFQGQLRSAINVIFQTGTKGMETLAALGIADVRDQLQLAAGNSELTREILVRAIGTAGQNFDRIAGGASASLLSIGAVTDLLGEQVTSFIPLSKAITKGFRERGDAEIKYADQLKVLWEEVWNPLKAWGMDVFVAVFPAIKTALLSLQDVVRGMTLKAIEWAANMGGLQGIATKVGDKLKEFADKVVSAIDMIDKVVSAPGKAASWVSNLSEDVGMVLRNVFERREIFVTPNKDRPRAKRIQDKELTLLEKIEKHLGKDALSFYEAANADLKKTAASVDEINEKTPDQRASSDFLQRSSLLLSESMDQILGIQSRDSMGLLEDMAGSLDGILFATTKTANNNGHIPSMIGQGQ